MIMDNCYAARDNEKVKGLREILSSKSDETKSNVCIEQLKSKNRRLDCNEVFENLFISDEETAKNFEFLKAVGVTHVLNAAEGQGFGMVHSDVDSYKDSGIKYLGLPLEDIDDVPLIKYVHQAADFIDEGLVSGGKVLAHCQWGISRSSSCVIAYLMIKKHMTVQEAIQQVKNHREIWPNDGFLKQLVDLDEQLRLKS